MEILSGLLALSILLALVWLSIKVVRLVVKLVLWGLILSLLIAAVGYYFWQQPRTKPSKPAAVSTRPVKRK
jgi:peptidoglycan/LPS O-acetylase OafA/YrhL